jgi:hypothetical protein
LKKEAHLMTKPYHSKLFLPGESPGERESEEAQERRVEQEEKRRQDCGKAIEAALKEAEKKGKPIVAYLSVRTNPPNPPTEIKRDQCPAE